MAGAGSSAEGSRRELRTTHREIPNLPVSQLNRLADARLRKNPKSSNLAKEPRSSQSPCDPYIGNQRASIDSMETVAGVFRLYQTARDAVGALRRAGFSENQVNLLSPASSQEEIHTIPTSGTEQPGVGGAIGGMLGGALGVAGGLELGMAAAVLIPGVGPVLAFGLAGAALLGVGGAAGGAALGNAADDKSSEGVPPDEIFFYEDALRQGRSVVLVLAGDHSEEQRAHKLLADAGAESLDAARKDWWLGLRDGEQEHYRALGHNFELDEDVYRAGFSSALRRECRGRSIDEEADCLKWWYPDVWNSEPFRRGYERGWKYWQMQAAGEALSAHAGSNAG